MVHKKIKPPSYIKKAMEKLERAGHESYLVGGCIRDYFSGIKPMDWDIATSATPEEIKEVFIGYQQMDSGIKHGTVMVIMEGNPVEITTFRVDMDYSDGRRPDTVYYTKNILEDLKRRDFTMNALAFSLSENKLTDPFGGKKDMERQLVRSVGDPVERFSEDALRILRGIRFASCLGFRVENETKAAMIKCKRLLAHISWERIRDEFIQTILGQNVVNALMEFVDILTFLLPEVKPMVGFNQKTPYHIHDVYEHTLKAVEAAPKDMLIRMAVFFHDIGKPSTFSLDDEGVGHFYGHARISLEITTAILKRMRFSAKDIKTITELVGLHHREINTSEKSIKRLLGRIGEEQFRRLLKVKKADTMGKNPRFIELRLKELAEIEKTLNKVLTEKPCITLKDLNINGRDLISIGIPEGKEIGIILDALLNMVIDEKLKNQKPLLLEEALKRCKI